MSIDATHPVSAQGFLEFELKLPNQTATSAVRTIVMERSSVFETVFDHGRAEIQFRTTVTDYVDTVLRASNATGKPLIRFRWGIGTGAQIIWTPWQLHYVVHTRTGFDSIGNNTGHLVILQTRDLLHLINRNSKTRPHRGTVSDVVKKLAAESGIAKTAIEPTTGEGIWIQSFEGDFDFVRSRLLCRARSTRGRGNYYLFVRDDTLHFRTVEYQAAVNNLTYFASAALRLEGADQSQCKLASGSSGVRLVVHDPYTGLSSEIANDPEKATKLGNTIARLDLIAGAQRNMQEHRVQLRNEEAGPTALAQNAYESARSENYQLKLQASGLAILRAGDILRIKINPNNSASSSWSGFYLIASCQHDIVKTELVSTYILQRGEYDRARTATSQSAYGVTTLQSQQAAPGHPLNVQEIQASSLTKVVGNSSGNGSVLTVQDKSAAPVPAPPTLLNS